jgi:hypothetical protein
MSATSITPASEAGHELVKKCGQGCAGRLGQVRVDGGRGDRAVTEQNLYNSEVDTAFDEPGRVTVPKAMQRGPGDAGLACRDREGTAERPTSDRAVAELVGKKPTRVPVGLPERAQLVQNWPRQQDDPLLVALADDPQLTVDPVDGPNLECGCLSGT